MYKKPLGVADNKSYKDMYHFSDKFNNDATLGDNPSIKVDPTINQSIKENPYRSNVEVEKDEVILQPDMSALFKARGKTHKQGGIAVQLRPNSFVFSNDKSLALSKSECKTFEFKKKGGTTHKPEDYTPAEVLKTNVNVKHYNTMIANITDLKKDDLAKKSSALMLEKYIQTLGNIAYLQEKKKDFPQGLPAFSTGTAPVYDGELKDKIAEQKQYAKYGGTITSPYRMPGGGTVVPCPCGKDANGKCLPCSDDVYSKILPSARRVTSALPGYDPLYTAPNGSQLFGKFGSTPGTTTPYHGPMMGNAKWSAWLKTPQGMAWSAKQKAPGQDTEDYIAIDPSAPVTPPAVTPPAVDNIPTPGTVQGQMDKGINPRWQFTPWQKVSQGWSALDAASVKRYMPYRSHENPSYINPYLVNPEQTVGDMKGAFNQNLGAINSLNPILRNAQASSSYGDFLNREPGVRSQYDNQNAGIINQTRQYNNQIANNAMHQNTANDQNYYQQSVVGQQNFDNMRDFKVAQWRNNVLGDVQDNQSLAYNLMTLKNPAYGFDFKSGNFYRNPKDIRDVQGTGKGDYLNEYLGKITQDWDKLDSKDKVNLLKVMVAKGFTPSTYKRGGMVKK